MNKQLKDRSQKATPFDWFTSQEFDKLDRRLLKKYMFFNNAASITIGVLAILFLVAMSFVFFSIF